MRYQLLTGVQAAGVAVFVLCGEVGGFLGARFSRVLRRGGVTYCDLLGESGEVVDDVVVAWVGEEEAEISCHGGPEVVRQVAGVLRGAGFVEDVGGERELLLSRCRTRLATAAVLGGEEMVGAWGHLVQPAVVAVVGLANVGKSSLVNALAGEEAAIVADVAGTTRDWVMVEADVGAEVGGVVVRLVDTPGVREGAGEIEVEAIERAREVIEGAALRVVVVDGAGGGGVSEGVRELVERYGRGGIVVVSRVDLGGEGVVGRVGEVLGREDVVGVSVVTGEGLREVRRRVLEGLGVTREFWGKYLRE